MTIKKFDVISLGRAAVDIYANELGTRLEDTHNLAKYLGGSAGNIAYGCARQGLRTAMLTRVGADHMGRFVKETFQKIGVDTSQIKDDPNRLTGLAFLAIKNKTELPLLFYRKDCADMGIRADDIDEDYIAATKVLVVTGTHFSQPATRKACFQALSYAKKHNVKVVLDIDFRPVLWGLTDLDQGANYFVSSPQVTNALQEIFPYCSVIVGTEEEIHIGGGHTATIAALEAIRTHTQAAIVLKRGHTGCQVFPAAIPTALTAAPLYKGFNVPVLSTVGAGDAFISGFMRGYVEEQDWATCARYGNASGAIVVSRHSCAPAIPTGEELDYYLEQYTTIQHIHRDPTINRLHRVGARERHWQQVAILAFDHRHPLEEFLSQQHNLTPTAYTPLLTKLKHLILQGFYHATAKLSLVGKAGILCDDTYGQDVLNDITGKNYLTIRPVEKARSVPLALDYGNTGLTMLGWPRSHVIKCLFFIDPDDDPSLTKQQLQTLRQLYEDCITTERELMLEWLPRTPSKKTPTTIATIMEKIYQQGIIPDWWKLLIDSQHEWQAASEQIEKYDTHCRGILLLGAANSMAHMEKLFALGSQQKWARGFAVGRTIFNAPAHAWLEQKISATECSARVSHNYENLVRTWGKFT